MATAPPEIVPQRAGAGIDSRTHIGAVALTVRDLDRAVGFYERALGLSARARDSATAYLGAGGPDLLVLHGNPDAPEARRATGLFHFAVLLPSRVDLARQLRQLARARVPLHGASDHLVSEALYLADPDGNGIEIYRDRPRAQWPRERNGIGMATVALDLEGLLGELDDAGQSSTDPADGAYRAPAATIIGHVHLRVAEVPPAERFYLELIGLDLMVRYGDQASFLAAGGYHHHVGINNWESRGAPPPPDGGPGLRHFELVLPDAAALETVATRLRDAQVATDETSGGLLVRDPSGNALLLRADG